MREDELLRRSLQEANPAVDGDVDWPRVLRRIRRRRFRSVMAPLAAVALVAGAVTAWITHDNGKDALVVSTNRTLPTGQSPTFVATGAGSAWVLTTVITPDNRPGDAGTLLRIDPASGAVVAVIPLSGAPARVTVDGSFAWVTLFNASAVAKIDLATNEVRATISLKLPKSVCSNDCPGAFDFLPVNVVAGDGGVWVSTARGYVAHIDAATNRVVAMIPTALDETGSMAIVNGAVLVSQGSQPIARIDASTDAVTHLANPADVVDELFSSPMHPELGVWMTVTVPGPHRSVIGIDPSTGHTVGSDLATDLRVRAVTDRVWVQGSGQMFPLSDRFGASAPRLSVPDAANVAVDKTSVWWTTQDSELLTRAALDGTHSETQIQVVGTLASSGQCPFMRYLPFKLTYLPGNAPLPKQPLLLGYHPASWAFPGGEIEMWRGADVPLPSEPTQPITVLGHKGRIGRISDGDSVVFNLGDSNDICSQWALVSHPGTTLEQTRAIAEGLVAG